MNIEGVLAETVKKNKEFELLARLEKNLNFFKQYIPDLYSKFSNYYPVSIFFCYDAQGELNLKNASCQEYVYARSPLGMSKESVAHFVRHPNFRVVRARPSEIIDQEDDIHHDTTNRAIALVEKEESVRNLKNGFYDFLILNGLGLGYVLEELLASSDVNHLIIVEPNEDIFYAALHVVDWFEVFSAFSCDDKSRSLNLVIGEEDGEVSITNTLDLHIKDIGIHHAVLPYVFNHLGSKAIDDLIDKFFKRMNFTLSAAGFSDDEIWSIGHTVKNWSERYPVLQKHAYHDGLKVDKPVFVIANGPSLDQSIEFIKKNNDKAIVISCGSTIGSLMKAGVKPDIHLEMERRYVTYEWLEEITTPEYRKGINFIGLNTVHPKVFELFEHSYVAMKPLDLGSRYCNRFVDPKSDGKCVLLLNSNPTVGNMGIAIASAIGFEEVYLFGLDLAMSSQSEHHSKLSAYYEIDDDKDEEFVKLELADEATSNLEVEGNFVDKVKTTRLFIGSIICAETTIKDSSYQQYYNASDGARLAGAEPIAVQNIKLGSGFDKRIATHKILESCFGRHGLLNLDNISDVYRDFSALEPSLLLFRRIFEKPFVNWQEVVERLDSQTVKVKDMDKLGPNMSCIHYLLKGSIFYWNLLFMQGLYRGENESAAMDLTNSMRKIYLEYIDRTIVKCKSGLLVADDKDTRLKDRLSNKK